MNEDIMSEWEDVPYNFTNDLLIATRFGDYAVKDTYKRVLKEYKNDYKVFTRFVYDLNIVCWYLYGRANGDKSSLIYKMSELFADLYYKADIEFTKKYNKNHIAMKYYFEKLD